MDCPIEVFALQGFHLRSFPPFIECPILYLNLRRFWLRCFCLDFLCPPMREKFLKFFQIFSLRVKPHLPWSVRFKEFISGYKARSIFVTDISNYHKVFSGPRRNRFPKIFDGFSLFSDLGSYISLFLFPVV